MDIVAKVDEIARPLIRAEGVELLSVTFGKEGGHDVLRLTIERDQAPTSVADCVAVSHSVGAALDACDPISQRYRLEVTSAGLTRPLRSLPDFKRSVGQLVRITLRHGRSGPLVGTLSDADESGLTLVLANSARYRVALPEISAARREIVFNARDDRGDGGSG